MKIFRTAAPFLQSMIRNLVTAVAVGLFVLLPLIVLAQIDIEELSKDPVAWGAWLYQGNCVSCHGPYGKEGVGGDRDEKELKQAIDGTGRESCQVAWGRTRGGPLGSREIAALAKYMLAWEELGHEPDLPQLPDYPTPTPYPTPTAPGGSSAATPEPTATPRPTLSPEVAMVVDDNQVAHGAYMYTLNCYRCHLDYGYARVGMDLSDKTIKRTIEQGKTGTSMPRLGWQQGGPLRSREILAIIAYITAYERLEAAPALPAVLFVPPTPDPAKLRPVKPKDVPPIEGDLERGGALFARHCAPCHGSDGKGGIGPNLARHWHSVRPDLTVRSTIVRGVPGSPMRAWHQAEGGPLDDQQINDLATLLLSWSPDPAPASGPLAETSDVAAAPLLLMTLGTGGVLIIVKLRRRRTR